MSIDNTQLMREVDAIIADPNSFTNIRIDVAIKVKGKWITPQRVDYYQIHRDYASRQLGDQRVVEFLIGYGDYVYDLLANRDDLVIDVTEVPLVSGGTQQDLKQRSVTKRFRGILNIQNNQDPETSGKSAQLKSRESMNQVGMIPVQVQLIDELVYRMLMVQVGKIYRKMTPMTALQSLITEYGNLLGGADNERLLGVDIRPGFNEGVRTQILIPDGTPLKDVPFILQESEGGLYGAGMGRYIQDQLFYIYPLYDTTRYLKNDRVLNVINVPNDRYQGAENTYRVTERHVTVIATGDASSLDDGLAQSLDKGNGLRFGDVRNLLTDFGISKDNRMLVDRASNVFETTVKPLATGFNNIRWAADRATSNPFKHYTEMARREGQMISLQWFHGDADILTPGMPVKFQTVSNNRVKTYHGVLLGVDEQRTTSDAGAISTRHPGVVTLGIFVNRFEIVETVQSSP